MNERGLMRAARRRAQLPLCTRAHAGTALRPFRQQTWKARALIAERCWQRRREFVDGGGGDGDKGGGVGGGGEGGGGEVGGEGGGG